MDHDSDALNISEAQLFKHANLAKVAKAELSIACEIYDDSASIAQLRLCIGRSSPPLRDLKCPLYLRILSIRC